LLPADSETAGFAVTPGARAHSDTATAQFISCLTSQKNRIVLSGTGGDEFTGGVPTPAPELADLVTRLKFRFLAHQLKFWALNKRKPWPHLLWEAARGFLPSALVSIPQLRQAPWLRPSFVRMHRNALSGYARRLWLFGELPSFQQNLSTLNAVRRQLACSPNFPKPLHERCYPFLDRDIVEFLCSIPCEQLVRPNQRRSLMRRALVGIVPDEILNRKRKAFLVRSPMMAMGAEWQEITQRGGPMLADVLGIVDQKTFAEALHNAQAGSEINVVLAQRVLALEQWLRHLGERNVIYFPPHTGTSQRPNPAKVRLALSAD
jgi:asparagine synthase (glutamine-hydrolysing)